MWRLEMGDSAAALVDLDYDECGDERGQSQAVEACVNPGAFLLLLRRVCRLENEKALAEDQKSGLRCPTSVGPIQSRKASCM
jgi:hypothetical protein